MIVIIILVIAIVLFLLGWCCVLPKEINVNETETINLPIHKVFSYVSDFNSWSEWSPWVPTQLNIHTNVTKDGKTAGSVYSWNDEAVGAGEVEHKEITEDSHIKQELRFIKPFHSINNITWQFSPSTDNQTIVSWSMIGRLPFYMRFFNKTMTIMISSDYSRGLAMMKSKLETGTVDSKVEVLGITDVDEDIHTVGLSGKIPFSELQSLSNITPQLFQKVDAFIQENNAQGIEESKKLEHIGIYDLSMISMETKYTVAIPIDETTQGSIENLKKKSSQSKEKFVFTTIEKGKLFKIRYTGDYRYIGNAWSYGRCYIQDKAKLKINNAVKPFEVYVVNSKTEKNSAKWITDICWGIK